MVHHRESTLIDLPGTEVKAGREAVTDLPELKTCPQKSRVMGLEGPE